VTNTSRSGEVGRWHTRACEAGDFPRWEALYRAYAEFYEVDQSEADRARVWSWITDPSHVVECLVVESNDDGVVGIAHYRPFARPLSATVGCFLDDLFVDPAHRGSGAADELLGAVRRLAREQNRSVVRWITHETNYRARALYDRHAVRTKWVTYDMPP
jgi:GNAT superfamily N-acetyltransferase